MQNQESNNNRIVTASFFGTCPSHSSITLVSKRIPTPFKTQDFFASFPINTNRTLLLRYYVSPDKSAPTSNTLTGQNLLDDYGQVDYITGDDEQKHFTHQVFFQSAGMYIKVFAENSDDYDHTIDTQILFQLIPRG